MVGDLITLYEHDEREFKTNGLGSLNDAASCAVLEERNGEFELTMEYPVMGRHFSDLILRRIIFAKPNPYDNPQPFRIYNISKPINGIVSVSAHHISYDLDGYPLAPFSSSSLLDTFEKINQQMTEPWNSDKPPFHFSTTKSGETESYDLVAPCSVRALLGGSEGTILDRWPGEYQWDIWEVTYHQHRGADRGVTIEYGKNLTDLEQEENCENCWTALYPYYYTEPQTDEEGNVTGGLVELKEKVIPFPGTYNYSRTYVLDLTGEFEEMPSEEEIRARAQKYIEDNELDSPKVSLTVSFLPLSETTSYSKLKILEEVKLCDTVHVYFPRLNVASTSMCISTAYDVLSGKYTEIQLGEAKSNLASTLAGQGNDTEKQIQDALKSNNNFIEDAIRKQTNMITGNAGGYVVLHDTNGDGMPDELLIMDHENIKDAVNIWRANSSGVGHSSTGYNGDYTTGWTMDGHFNASLITVGELWANIIKAGILSDQKGYNYWNMETGEFRMAATATVDGQTIPSIAEEKANGALKDAKAYSDESIGGFIQDTYNPRIAELQKQLDGQIETYYYDYKPTIQNEPASLWTSDEEKARHEGDLFYWKTKGYAYRFFKDGSTWKWQLVQDTDITQALAKADTAQDTADHKRRVFVDTPTPPYDVGDLWVQGSKGDILRCQTKKTGGAFSQNDWILASKYTDDSALTTFLNGEYKTAINNLTSQVDKKAETWYQSANPADSWSTTQLKNDHVGDMWYCTSSSDTTHYGKYWIWDGAIWTEMIVNPPKSVFDSIDGKAQIFVGASNPTVPYHEGDLWFKDSSSDIMTCVKTRTSGSYLSSEWEKYNKYIDQTAAESAATNAVNGQTPEDVLNRLTDNKKIQGLYMENGNLYFNGTYIAVGKISSKNGLVYFDLDNNELACSVLKSAQPYSGPSYPSPIYLDIAYRENEYHDIYSSAQIYRESNEEDGLNFDPYPASVPNNFNYDGSTIYSYRPIQIVRSPLGGMGLFDGRAELNLKGWDEDIGAYLDGGVSLRYMKGSSTGVSSADISIGDDGSILIESLPKSVGRPYVTIWAANGIVEIDGDLIINGGSKSRAVETPNYGTRLHYCYETSSPLFGDVGEAETDENGECYIYLDGVFSETVSNRMEYHVFLQKEGPGDLWVSEKKNNYFVIRGTKNLKFSWEIKAHQYDYEYERLERPDRNTIYNFTDPSYVSIYEKEVQTIIKEMEDALYETT